MSDDNNNHHSKKISSTPLGQTPPSIHETTCTTVTNIPCHRIKQKKEHSSSCQCSSKIKHHQNTIPTSFLPHEDSSNLCNIFRSLSFPNMQSKVQDKIPVISTDYPINPNVNHEQFQILKSQFHTYLNEIQFNSLSRVIQLLSLYNHLNNEQIKDFLHHIGYSNISIDDINRITTSDRRIIANEKLENFRTILHDHRNAKD